MPSEQVETLLQELLALPLIEQLRTQPLDVAGARQNFEQFDQIFPLSPDVRIEKVSASGVPAEWVSAPEVLTDRAILFFHGGGYVIGSINTHRELCSRISRASDARVLLIDYRLAPEHPHPAAVEDAMKAFRWIRAQGISAGRVVLMGDSAGGGLAIAMLALLRSTRMDMPAAGVCLSPWIDLECIGKMPKLPDRVLTKEGLRELGRLYLGGKDPRTPFASALYADLKGLPPIYIQAGTAEILLDDTDRLAERAAKSGVEVNVDTWNGLFHVFQLYPMLPEAREAVDKIGAYVRAHT
jgi:acetyl esterase/lipase